MKTFLFICMFLTLNRPMQAQDNIPSYGKIDKAELEMQDCSFDPGAEAVILLDIGEIEFSYINNTGWVSETKYRIRVKILKEKGVNQSEIKLPYYAKNGRENISNIGGVSYNLDPNGNIEESKLDSRNIYDRPINKEYSEISFALPNVKTGSVFEYKYKITRKSFFIPSWGFQQSIPVKYSAYNVAIPEYFQFTLLVTKRQEMEKKTGSGINESVWYIMRNIKGLKDEPFSSGKVDYMQRIDFQLSGINAPGYYEEIRTTWAKINEELLEDEDFGQALKRNLKGINEIVATAMQQSSTAERIRVIYNYVQRNMQWNENYGLYSFTGIKEAWDKKNGSITDINFILINMLKEAGVAAKPLLVSTKDHGMVNPLYPFLKRFNAVLAYVIDGDVEYIMNAADKYNPYNLVPYDVINTYALLVDKSVNAVRQLGSNGKFANNIFFTCSVAPDGKISGQANLKSSGYARNIRMSTLKKHKLKEMIEDNEGIIIKVDSLAVNNEDDESQPLEQVAEYSGSMQEGGGYSFLPYNLFTGLGKNPFIEESRVMDIDFNFPKSYVISGTYYLPDEYTVNELPKNTRLIMPDTSIILTRKMQQDGNIISFRVTLDMLYADYIAEGYPYIKDFFKKMYALLNERIALKKK
ncbi:MAG: DUF3857 domain-containing protein [Ferruginibacter sp.]|nr:DUF3857 domain-containing protein [Ferruginibacter sp.]